MPARPEYDMHFDEQEANVVLQGLGELPSRVGYNLITKVAQIIATTNRAWQDQQDQPQEQSKPQAGLIAGLRESVNGAAPAQDNP